MNSERQARAFELFLNGETYATIGAALKVSRQRVQQMVRPPKAIYDAVKSLADGKCQKCGIVVSNGHVHHKRSDKRSIDTFNRLEFLEYLCPSCHRSVHPFKYTYKYRGPRPRKPMAEIRTKAVAQLREMLGKGTQVALAQQLHISPSYLSEVLRGTREPGAAVLRALGLEAITEYHKAK